MDSALSSVPSVALPPCVRGGRNPPPGRRDTAETNDRAGIALRRRGSFPGVERTIRRGGLTTLRSPGPRKPPQGDLRTEVGSRLDTEIGRARQQWRAARRRWGKSHAERRESTPQGTTKAFLRDSRPPWQRAGRASGLCRGDWKEGEARGKHPRSTSARPGSSGGTGTARAPDQRAGRQKA